MRGRKILTMKGSGVFAILLALLYLHLQSSVSHAQSTTITASYRTLPLNKTVSAGKPAVFQCGVSLDTVHIVFTIYTSTYNYSLNCPGPEVLPVKTLKGSCRKTTDQLIADWRFSATSSSDNNTRIKCTQSGQSPVEAYLIVDEDSTRFATIIGCSIGGFFGTLLVFGLSYVMVRRSPTLQQCFSGGDSIDELTLVSKD